MRRDVALWSIALLCAVEARAADRPYRYYTHQQAQAALQVAQRECKPLVLHFVPDDAVGAEQTRAYYGAKSPIPRADLERVVVVVIPKSAFPEFAEAMRVDDAGGLRTVSPYEMTFTDRFALTTVRETLVRRRGRT